MWILPRRSASYFFAEILLMWEAGTKSLLTMPDPVYLLLFPLPFYHQSAHKALTASLPGALPSCLPCLSSQADSQGNLSTPMQAEAVPLFGAVTYAWGGGHHCFSSLIPQRSVNNFLQLQ